MKFLVGAVREPPLRVDFHAKACGCKKEFSEHNSFSIIPQEAVRIRQISPAPGIAEAAAGGF
jgi:hypothetical protein